MKEISLIVSVAGTLILFVVPIKLSLSDTIRTDWDYVFPSWRKWLAVGLIFISLGFSLLFWG
jgi:hypothetical protein